MRKGLKQVAGEIVAKEKKEKVAEEKEVELEEVPVEVPYDLTEVIGKVIRWNFDFLARRYGKKWHLEDEEVKELTEAYSNLAEKYLPTIIGKFSVELNAIFCTGFIILKRL